MFVLRFCFSLRLWFNLLTFQFRRVSNIPFQQFAVFFLLCPCFSSTPFSLALNTNFIMRFVRKWFNYGRKIETQYGIICKFNESVFPLQPWSRSRNSILSRFVPWVTHLQQSNLLWNPFVCCLESKQPIGGPSVVLSSRTTLSQPLWTFPQRTYRM